MRTSIHDDMDADDDRRLGSRYVLDAVLGRGTTGEVWRAHDETGVTVAIKLLRPELVEDPEVVARFLHERPVMRSVRDEHLVGVHDLVIEGDTLAIVMDHVSGRDLRTYLEIRDGPPPPRVAIAVVDQILRGLGAVHRAGMVHRDVKPANVLVDERVPGVTVVKLSDFGLSRLLDGTTVSRTTGVLGAPRYMAPELGDGHDPTPSSDLYAVGVMLYELLTARLPFVTPDPVAMLHAHAEEPVVRPDGLPISVWHVVSTLLAKRPEGRFPDAETARRAVELAAAAVAVDDVEP